MHYNTTLIPTIAATGISCNITSVDFSYWILAKGTGLLCVWFFNMSQESPLFYSLDSKSLQTLLLTSALPAEVLQLRMRFRVAWQPRFQVWQQFLSVLQIPQNMKDSVFFFNWILEELDVRHSLDLVHIFSSLFTKRQEILPWEVFFFSLFILWVFKFFLIGFVSSFFLSFFVAFVFF